MPGKYRKYRKINYSNVAAFMRKRNNRRKRTGLINLRYNKNLRRGNTFMTSAGFKRYY